MPYCKCKHEDSLHVDSLCLVSQCKCEMFIIG
uniref:Metallothionein n=1 Tax=Nitrosopumivirus cobalaminus TaxID=3158414 RepID=A0AAU7N487_9VIRU